MIKLSFPNMIENDEFTEDSDLSCLENIDVYQENIKYILKTTLGLPIVPLNIYKLCD